MDEEKKGFNLSVLISLLVGVISLIVVIPSISMIMNKTRPEVVKPEEYRLIFNKNYEFEMDFDGPSLKNATTLGLDLSSYGNLISASSTQENIVITVSYPDEEDLYNLNLIYITGDSYTSEYYALTYLDPVSNEKLYGTYDFSNITITEADQVLNPIYTPF